MLLFWAYVVSSLSTGAYFSSVEDDIPDVEINSTPLDCPKQQEECPESYQGKPPPLLLISLDGFRPSYFKRGYSPTLNKIARCGTRAPYTYPAFPSMTFPNHYSIVTGLNPESHGLVANQMYDPQSGKLFRFSGPEAKEPMWYQKEPIWVTSERQGKKTALYFWPACDVPIAGILPSYYKEYTRETRYIEFSKRVDQILEWLLLPAEERPSFLTIYVNQPDNKAHAKGLHSEEVNQAISDVDQMIEQLFDGLVSNNILNCVNVMIVSDHGGANNDCNKVVDISKYIDISNLNITIGTFGKIRFNGGETDAAVINDLIERMRCQSPSMRVYAKEQLPVRMHYAGNDRIDPIFLDLDNGWIVLTYPAQPGDGICSHANHGYDNLYPDMRGIFMAHGPSIKSKHVVKPFILTELYELMAELIDIVPNPNNGTRGSLHGVLRSPTTLFPQVEPVPPITAFVTHDPEESRIRIGAADCTCPKHIGQEDTVDMDSKRMLHCPFGVPWDKEEDSNLRLLYNEDYVVAYNLEYKMPAWTSFTISGQKDIREMENDCFIADVRISAPDMAKCSHFDHEIVRESHISPRPLYYPGFSDIEIKAQAYLVSNMIPKSLNHTKVIEGTMNKILAVLSQEMGRVNVVMGPAFNLWANGLRPSFEKISELKEEYGHLLVPTHIFVIASWCSEPVESLNNCSPSKIEVYGYLLPNVPFAENCESDVAVISKNVARIVDIENLTGISFFTGLPTYDAMWLRTRMPPSINE